MADGGEAVAAPLVGHEEEEVGLERGGGRSRGDGSESEYAGEPCEGDEGAMGGNGKIGVEGVEPREAEG